MCGYPLWAFAYRQYGVYWWHGPSSEWKRWWRSRTTASRYTALSRQRVANNICSHRGRPYRRPIHWRVATVLHAWRCRLGHDTSNSRWYHDSSCILDSLGERDSLGHRHATLRDELRGALSFRNKFLCPILHISRNSRHSFSYRALSHSQNHARQTTAADIIDLQYVFSEFSS